MRERMRDIVQKRDIYRTSTVCCMSQHCRIPFYLPPLSLICPLLNITTMLMPWSNSNSSQWNFNSSHPPVTAPTTNGKKEIYHALSDMKAFSSNTCTQHTSSAEPLAIHVFVCNSIGILFIGYWLVTIVWIQLCIHIQSQTPHTHTLHANNL